MKKSELEKANRTLYAEVTEHHRARWRQSRRIESLERANRAGKERQRIFSSLLTLEKSLRRMAHARAERLEAERDAANDQAVRLVSEVARLERENADLQMRFDAVDGANKLLRTERDQLRFTVQRRAAHVRHATIRRVTVVPIGDMHRAAINVETTDGAEYSFVATPAVQAYFAEKLAGLWTRAARRAS